MRQKSSSGKWRSRQNVASGGKGSKGSGGKELNGEYSEIKLTEISRLPSLQNIQITKYLSLSTGYPVNN